MKILTKNNVIIAISKTAEIVSNGIKLDNYILGIAVGQDGKFAEELPKIYDVAIVPPEVTEEKYCYTEENGFYLNSKYKDSINTKDEIKQLKDQLNTCQQSIAELTALATSTMSTP